MIDGRVPTDRGLSALDRHPDAFAEDPGKQERDWSFVQDAGGVPGCVHHSLLGLDLGAPLGVALFQRHAHPLPGYHWLHHLRDAIQATLPHGALLLI